MQTPAHNPTKKTTTARGERIAAMHGAHARALERRVARRACASAPQTIEDACAFAWLQLLTHPHVDLSVRRRVLGWLELTATREAWRLDIRRARDGLGSDVALEDWLDAQTVAGADEVAAQRERLALVDQLPARPRRFLLRQALGRSYLEIAADEDASLTTTNKQIATAKRLLRALDRPT
jgi:DNA-directed RNA polymerase specialized sigma24 family protein